MGRVCTYACVFVGECLSVSVGSGVGVNGSGVRDGPLCLRARGRLLQGPQTLLCGPWPLVPPAGTNPPHQLTALPSSISFLHSCFVFIRFPFYLISSFYSLFHLFTVSRFSPVVYSVCDFRCPLSFYIRVFFYFSFPFFFFFRK